MSRRLNVALLVFGASTAAGVYFASQLHYAFPEPLMQPWAMALRINLIYYWVWGALVPVVIFLARRFPLEGGRWKLSLPVHLLLGAVVTLAQIAVAAGLLSLVWRGCCDDLLKGVSAGFLLNFHSSYPTYLVILFAYLSYEYHEKYRDRTLRASLLEARLSEARLVALKVQLNPHFLFNTLHSISALMHTDVHAADAMMARLGELLRLTLDTEDQEVTLHKELALLDRYLEIEKIRFEDRLRVKVDIDPAALDCRVPTLALQPLVENAIRHAIAPRAAGGQLEISAHRDNGSLQITIADDGPGLPEGAVREGVGLANTRARIEQLYGPGHGLVLRTRSGGGLEAVLMLPYREEQAKRHAHK